MRAALQLPKLAGRPSALGRAALCLSIVVPGLFTQLVQADPQCPPPYEWQRSFGGGNDNQLRAMAATDDGGMILAGLSTSDATGNKTCAGFGEGDGWLVRLDQSGGVLWQLCLGGTAPDSIDAIEQTGDGGFIAVGLSYSPPSGNKTAPLTRVGNADTWLVRLSGDGQVMWDRSLGAGGLPLRVHQNRDGGYIVGASYPLQPPGEVSTSKFYGGGDFAILRLDASGHRTWDASFGSSGDDLLSDLVETEDGGFLLVGSSREGVGGNKSAGTIGGIDAWVVRVDTQGRKLWDKAYGTFGTEGFCCVAKAPGDGFFLGGSMDRGRSGGGDYWVVRIDGSGTPLWMEWYGTSGRETLRSMALLPDGGLVLGGESTAGPADNMGDRVSLPVGGGDYWLVRLDASGAKLWDVAYGADDEAGSLVGVIATSENRIVFGAASSSSFSSSAQDGLTGNRRVRRQGIEDYWIVRFVAEDLSEGVRLCPSSVGIAAKRSEQVGFRFRAVGPTNLLYTIESSTNLTDWVPFRTNIPGAFLREVLDPSITNSSHRFFRARAGSPP